MVAEVYLVDPRIAREAAECRDTASAKISPIQRLNRKWQTSPSAMT